MLQTELLWRNHPLPEDRCTLRNMTVKIIFCCEQLCLTEAHSKIQLGPTRSRIPSTTFPKFNLHIFDYHCSTRCQRDLGRFNLEQSLPLEAGARVQTLLGHTAPDLNHKPVQAERGLLRSQLTPCSATTGCPCLFCV